MGNDIITDGASDGVVIKSYKKAKKVLEKIYGK